ncbi:Adherence factor [Spathaspora sp. JA1]|nr:Adherence factor [Spathaspora sp. JA1]
MSSYDNNNNNQSNFHHPHYPNQQVGVPHTMKDNTYEGQPRFYTSPMVMQQPQQAYLMNNPNAQYGLNQQMMYPPPPIANYPQQQQTQQTPVAQQQSQQGVNQFFDPSMPNNYLLIQQANQGANLSMTPNQANTTPQQAMAQNFYNPNFSQFHQGTHPHIQPTNISHKSASVGSNQQVAGANSGNTSATSGNPVSATSSASGNSTSANSNVAASVIYPNFPERIQPLLPVPPLYRSSTRPDLNINLSQKRAKRKSKFSKQQDDMIVSLKKKGKSWVEIAEITGVGSYLAARNRYQVIVGQQGNNNSSSWDLRDKVHLQEILDAGELEKWRFISNELNKSSNKNFTDLECREMIRELFWNNPASFGVNEETINECLKEKKLTDKSIEQRDQQLKKRADIVEGKFVDAKKETAGNANNAGVVGDKKDVYYPPPLPHPYQRGYPNQQQQQVQPPPPQQQQVNQFTYAKPYY